VSFESEFDYLLFLEEAGGKYCKLFKMDILDFVGFSLGEELSS